uniref:Histone H2A/H2B/H3 domain-containing protein n=1 Tax=Ditylenchus dipsaci TaxID=166011 RepID=A0A915CWA9_9BILA
MEVEEEPVLPITSGEATAALKILQLYVDENIRDPAVLHLIRQYLSKWRERKQTSTKARIQEVLQPASQIAYKTPNQSVRPQLATKGARMSESIDGTQHKKIRQKNGALAMMEIKKYQKSVNLLIPRRPFHRLVREVAVNFKQDILFKAETMEILQEAAEMYLTSTFEESYLICLHTGRVTLMEKDIKLLQRIRGLAHTMPKLY